MAKRRAGNGRSCPLYPVGRSDARLSGAFGASRAKRAAVCTTPESCPPDSGSPEYHQVLALQRKGRSESFTSSCAIYDYFKSLKYQPGEHFYAVGLDYKNRTTVISKVAQGGRKNVDVDTRLVFAPLLASGALNFALVHQHPSGDPGPSHDDIAMTRRLRDGGKLLGLALVDHIIIGDNNYVSMRDTGVDAVF
jgi:DNA repair protein RadC